MESFHLVYPRSLLLRDDDAPGVFLALPATVHDVADPGLELCRDGAALAGLAHGDADVAAAVVDQRHGADEIL